MAPHYQRRTSDQVFDRLENNLWGALHQPNPCHGLSCFANALHREYCTDAAVLSDEQRDTLLEMFDGALIRADHDLIEDAPHDLITAGVPAVITLIGLFAQPPAEREKVALDDRWDLIDHVRRLHNSAFSASLRHQIGERAAEREAKRKAEAKHRARPTFPDGHMADVIPFPNTGLFE